MTMFLKLYCLVWVILYFLSIYAFGDWILFYYFVDKSQNEPPIVPNSPTTVDKQPIINTSKVQHLPKINQVKQEKQINPDTQPQKNKLAATLKQLDQYKLIRKQSSSEESSQQQEDEIENEKIRKVTIHFEAPSIMLLVLPSSSQNYYIFTFSQCDYQALISLKKKNIYEHLGNIRLSQGRQFEVLIVKLFKTLFVANCCDNSQLWKRYTRITRKRSTLYRYSAKSVWYIS